MRDVRLLSCVPSAKLIRWWAWGGRGDGRTGGDLSGNTKLNETHEDARPGRKSRKMTTRKKKPLGSFKVKVLLLFRAS